MRGQCLSKKTTLSLTPAIMYLTLFCGGVFLFQPATAYADIYRVPVTTVKVQQERRVVPVYSSGKLANKNEFRLGFKTGGIIDQISVEEGQYVEAGEALATLNLKEVNAQLESAKTQQKKAQRDYQRLKKIYRKKVITLEQLQNARSDLQLAQAELQIAQFNWQYSTITAPGAGRVLKRLAETNELIVAGEPVFLMAADATGWVVRVGLTDKDIVRLQLGDTATLALDAFPGAALSGEVSEIAAVASEQTGLFKVEVAVLEPPAQLRSGFIARVSIAPSIIEALIYLPIESVVAGARQRGEVYVYDPQTSYVKKRVVDIVFCQKTKSRFGPGSSAKNRL